jgi:TM2 domain-containing membrane protein YozV
MYKIIGADGREYGPVTVEQLHQWIREGRANAQTKVQPEGSTEWKTLVEIPGFAAAPPAASPPTLPPAGTRPVGADKKIPAGVCGILLGCLGVHKFILGYTREGMIMLLITILSCGIGGALVGVIGLIEGIIYLTKSDEEFVQTYVQNKKGWF